MAVVDRLRHADVEGLRVGRFTSQLNTTCILYRLGSTVLDTGPPNQWRHVRRFIFEREVERVLVTHHHEDHSGNLAAVGRATGSTLLAPAGGVAPLAVGFPLQVYRRIIWGRPARVRPEPLPESLDLGGGLTVRAVPTPGHSPDSTCFLLPERGWLFAGDLYIAAQTRYLRADENVGQQIESLRRALALDFDTLFCSHRGVLVPGKEPLRRKLDYLVSLRERVRALYAEGRTVPEITRRLLGPEGWMRRFTLSHFSKRNLVEGCLADADRDPQPRAAPQASTKSKV